MALLVSNFNSKLLKLLRLKINFASKISKYNKVKNIKFQLKLNKFYIIIDKEIINLSIKVNEKTKILFSYFTRIKWIIEVFYFLLPLIRNYIFYWGGTIRRFFQNLKKFLEGETQLDAKISMISNGFLKIILKKSKKFFLVAHNLEIFWNPKIFLGKKLDKGPKNIEQGKKKWENMII